MSKEREEFLKHLRNIRETKQGDVDESNIFWASRLESERITREQVTEKKDKEIKDEMIK